MALVGFEAGAQLVAVAALVVSGVDAAHGPVVAGTVEIVELCAAVVVEGRFVVDLFDVAGGFGYEFLWANDEA